MCDRNIDIEVRLLASYTHELKADYLRVEGDDPWTDSPFDWIRCLRSGQIGKIGAQLVARWCTEKGLTVIPSGDTQADRVINGKRVEIKTSTRWKTGIYMFQQIRDQDYDYAVCLGISPFDAHCWVLSKDVLRRHVIGKTPQHKGKAGSDTFWLTVDPDNPHEWLSSCGGALASAYEIIRNW
ncbi:MAG: hypothetical protein HUU17_04410 [Chthonomonadales bacterium]|nr:hypothetical protein [Chthonomonadales bacterium]